MRKTLSLLAVSVNMLTVDLLFLHNMFTFRPEYPITTLSGGWPVTYHNEQYINSNLEKLSTRIGSGFNRGDTITLTYASPLSAPEVPFPYLLLNYIEKKHYSKFQHMYLDPHHF